MTSKKQVDSNRLNARQSTGPSTAKGKTAIKHNAVRHGLTANTLVLPGENAEEFELLRDQFIDDFKPETVLEQCLVERLVTAAWRLRRVLRVETGMFAAAVEQMIRWEHIADSITRCKSQVERDTARMGCAFPSAQGDSNALAQLARYEAAIERSFYRALHALRSEQASHLTK